MDIKMIFKKLFTILIVVILCLSGHTMMAETVSQKEAMRVAQLFFNSLYGEVTAPAKLVWNGRQLTTDRLFSPFYVYNSPKGGFVIISAENKAYPILAYSMNENFGREKLGEEENNLLSQYAHEIELIRYDSRVPTSALHAWQNLPGYISKTITNPYNTSEYNNLSEARKDRIEAIDRRNGWIAMPGAVEFEIYDPDLYRPISLDDALIEENEEYIPFSFYENFVSEVKKENRAREIQLEEMLSPTRPVVTPLGGAHFKISFPEDIRLLRVYGMDGSRAAEHYYKGLSVANLDISSLNPGFYVGFVLGETGKVYGFKLYR